MQYLIGACWGRNGWVTLDGLGYDFCFYAAHDLPKGGEVTMGHEIFLGDQEFDFYNSENNFPPHPMFAKLSITGARNKGISWKDIWEVVLPAIDRRGLTRDPLRVSDF